MTQHVILLGTVSIHGVDQLPCYLHFINVPISYLALNDLKQAFLVTAITEISVSR